MEDFKNIYGQDLAIEILKSAILNNIFLQLIYSQDQRELEEKKAAKVFY